MKERINTYFALILIAVAGVGAAGIIVRVALNSNRTQAAADTEATYAALQQSILDSRNN